MASLLDLAQARLGGLLAPQRPSMAGLLGGQRTQGNLASALQGYTPPQMTALTNPQVMDYARNVAQSAQQNLQTQMSDLDKAIVMGQQGVQVGDRDALARLMEQVPGLMGATAYHGTPHTIRGKFDISKVGTGEGNQSYGYGMYFAENPAVATQYKNILSKPEFTKTAEGVELRGQLPRMLDESYSELIAKNGIQQTNYGDVTDLVGQRLDRQMKDALKAKDMDWYNKVADMKLDLARFKENPPPNVGNLYKVDVPDEYIPNMLNWDEPFSKQTKSVQEAVKQIEPKIKMINPDINVEKMNGQQIYRAYQQYRGNNPDFASEGLNELGIKGIKYLDQGSRNPGFSSLTPAQLDSRIDGIKESLDAGLGNKEVLERQLKSLQTERDSYKNLTSNFVVFDPTDVKILEKNSQKVEGLLD